MAIRDKMAQNTQALLEPGEQVQAVVGAQTNSGWLAVIPLLSILINRYRLIVATDRRIVLLDCGMWSMAKPKSIIASVPRSTRIGPPSGLWWKCLSLGPAVYVHKRFHKDVEQADAALPTG